MKFNNILNGSFVDNVLNETVTNEVMRQQDQGREFPTDQQEMQKICIDARNELQKRLEQQN